MAKMIEHPKNNRWDNQGTAGATLATTPLSESISSAPKSPLEEQSTGEEMGSLKMASGPEPPLAEKNSNIWDFHSEMFAFTSHINMTAEVGSFSEREIIDKDISYFATLSSFIDSFLTKMIDQPREYKKATFENFEDLLYNF